jgi:hypothetical protein
MSIPIKSSEMLMQVLNQDMTKVLDAVAEDVLERIKEVVNYNVYELYPPSPYYERLGENGGFLGAWKKSFAELVGGCIQSDIEYAPELLYYSPSDEGHHHGNPQGVDRRISLARYVEEGTDYDFGGNAAIPRPFWDVVERMLEDGSFDFFVEAAFRKYGIQYIKAF